MSKKLTDDIAKSLQPCFKIVEALFQLLKDRKYTYKLSDLKKSLISNDLRNADDDYKSTRQNIIRFLADKHPEINIEQVEAAAKKNKDEAKREPVTERCIRAFEERQASPDEGLCLDQHQRAYAHILVDEVYQTLPVRSKDFKSLLSYIYLEATGKTINSAQLNAVVTTLEGKALHEGRRIQLENRIRLIEDESGPCIAYDLNPAKGLIIQITSHSWQLAKYTEPLFRRFKHQKPQIIPIQAEDDFLDKFCQLLKISSNSEKQLFKVVLVSYFIPEIPHIVSVHYGPQGSIKSTVMRSIRSIVDPSSVPLLSEPKDRTEAVQQIDHNYAAFYDNVSQIKGWLSDLFCRAVTGDGFTKRELFSDDDDVIYNFQRIISLNGINNVAGKPDLQDRSIFFAHERIPQDQRLTEKQYWTKFNSLLPSILGQCFTSISKAISIKEGLNLKRLPRMADFAEWGEAISQALGYEPNSFMKEYQAAIGRANRDTLESYSIGPAILEIMKNRDIWQGTPTDLYGHLEEVAQALKLDVHAKGWPKAPNSLLRRLKELQSNLQDEGITYDIVHSGERMITILRNKPSEPSNCPNETVQNQDIVHISSNFPPSKVDSSDDMDGSGLKQQLNENYQIVDVYDQHSKSDLKRFLAYSQAKNEQQLSALFDSKLIRDCLNSGLIVEFKPGCIKWVGDDS